MAVSGRDCHHIDAAIRLACAPINSARDETSHRIDAQAIRKPCCSEAQRVAVWIAKASCHGNRNASSIQIDPVGDRRRNRHIIDQPDADGQRCCRSSSIAVIYRISDDIDPVEIGVGGVSDRAVRVDHDPTIGGTCGCHGESISVWIAIIGKDGDCYWGIFLR